MELEFRVNTMNLLNEIADCGLREKTGILKVPLNVFRVLLARVAQRAIELDDPKLHILMLSLGLYNVPDMEISNMIEKIEQKINDNEK